MLSRAISRLVVVITTMVILGNYVAAYEGEYILESSKVSNSITLEASNPIWNKAKEFKITLSETPYKPEGFTGIAQTKVVLQSLYDDKNLYIKMQYDDPTKSLKRFPWIKQKDGSWKQLMNKDSTGHENDYYEDKVAFLWNISDKSFNDVGCAVSCHMTTNGMNNGISDKSAGRKYTNSSDETIDIWHWKSIRTGLAFDLSHDQYIDNVADPKKNKDWGRHGDEKTSGGYQDNITEDKQRPKYMSKNKKSTLYYIKDEDKIPFVDTFKEGDMIPGIVVEKMTGSAADVQTSSQYENGKWTLVFKRALITNHPKSKQQDVQFSDMKKPYYFGVAVFDNTQINHMFHYGSIKLLFK